MKRKKNQENEEPRVCEPVASYNRTSAGQPNPIKAPDTAEENSLMSVDEYFDKLWSVVEMKYENLQR